MKNKIKQLIKLIPIAFTQNQRYDKQTEQIIAKVCKADTNCIDVGCHKGEVMDMIIKSAPRGQHYAFEPIPEMFKSLKEKYSSTSIKIYDKALSDQEGTSTFNHVVSNPSYSGLVKRTYDHADEEDTTITVETKCLDDIIPRNIEIGLIKIDVEGGEVGVLKGAKNILNRDKPVVIFEHGLGASDHYDVGPEDVFSIFEECDMQVSTMKNWLQNKPALTKTEFKNHYYQKLNFNFIGYK